MDDSMNLIDGESPINLGQHGQDYLGRLEQNGDPVGGVAQARLAALDAQPGLSGGPGATLLAASATAQDGDGQPGSPAPAPQPNASPLPPQYQWVHDPQKLSDFLTEFNAKNPLNPSNAPQAVKDVYDNMKAPSSNYSPPAGANADVAKYWSSYFGYPDQYANNKVSVESKNTANAWVPSTQAGGLEQVRPIAAADVGFSFDKRNKEGNLVNEKNIEEFRTAMADPSFATMVGSMVARKSFNEAGGDPFRAEAGYRNGFGTLREAERAGEPWPNPGYVRNMFPGQWTLKR